MTHPEDSTRLQAMLHNSSSNRRRRDLQHSMPPRARPGASDRHPTFHSLPQAACLLCERAQIRLHTTASSKAHNTPLPLPSNKARSSTPKTCNQQTHHANRRNHSRSIKGASCTAWASHRHHKRRSPRTSRNTDKDQIRRPRHWRPNSACHNPPNTTLQDQVDRRARRLPSILHNRCLPNINSTSPSHSQGLLLPRCTPAR